jgi:hypothetical protein
MRAVSEEDSWARAGIVYRLGWWCCAGQGRAGQRTGAQGASSGRRATSERRCLWAREASATLAAAKRVMAAAGGGCRGRVWAGVASEREMRRFHLGFPILLDWPRRLQWLRVVRGLQRCGSHLCRD